MPHDVITGVTRQRVLITGATTGLGFAMAKALAGHGAKVMVTGRDAARVDAAVAALGNLPGEVLGAVMDVRNEASIAAGLERMLQRWGGIDVLVNNAGIGMRTVNPDFLTDPKPFWAVATERFRDLVDTNVTGYFLAAKAAVPRFIAQGRGRIVNISVSLETMRRKGFVPYGPSRAATDALSQIMTEDLRPFGVTVNLLLPGGATDTGMIPEGFPAERRAQLLSPDVMAAPILYLCSDAAAGVTGERIIAKDFEQWLAAR